MPDRTVETQNPTSTEGDRLEKLDVSLVILPLESPISDAKVSTGRQKPLTEVAFLFVEAQTVQGHQGLGFELLQAGRGSGAICPRLRKSRPT